MLAALTLGILISRPQGVPWKEPFRLIEDLPTPAVIERVLGKESGAISIQGKVLTFAARSKADGVRMTGGIQMPLKKLPGSDLWALQLEYDRWDRAVITYGFVDTWKDKIANSNVRTRVYRGRHARPAPEMAEPLRGTLLKVSFPSRNLGTERGVMVYLPPDCEKLRDLPAVFMADGQSTRDFAQVLEPLIREGRVRPTVIVGMYHGDYVGGFTDIEHYDASKDLRFAEYIEGPYPERFDAHMKFVADELVPWAIAQFHVSPKAADHVIFGFSNGGAFAAAAAVLRPDVFQKAFPFSMAIPPTDEPKARLGRFWFACGTLESFEYLTDTFFAKAKGWGVRATMDKWVGGHDSALWQGAFAKAIQEAFPAPRPTDFGIG